MYGASPFMLILRLRLLKRRPCPAELHNSAIVTGVNEHRSVDRHCQESPFVNKMRDAMSAPSALVRLLVICRFYSGDLS